MQDHEKWSAHLEYLKVAITLATAIVAASAAMYLDDSKIPAGWVKYILLAAVVSASGMLLFSILGVIRLGNFLTTKNGSNETELAKKVTRVSGISFFFSVATGAAFLLFVVVQTTSSRDIAPTAALQNVAAILKGQLKTDESLALQRLELKGGKYSVDFAVLPGPGAFHASLDAASGRIEAIERRP